MSKLSAAFRITVSVLFVAGCGESSSNRAPQAVQTSTQRTGSGSVTEDQIVGVSPPTCAAGKGVVYKIVDLSTEQFKSLDPADQELLRGIGGSSYHPVYCPTITSSDLVAAGRKVTNSNPALCAAVHALPVIPGFAGADAVGGNQPFPKDIVDAAIATWVGATSGGPMGEGEDEAFTDAPWARYHAAEIGVMSAANAYCPPPAG